MNGQLPVMDVLHKFGVFGPSRCFCCWHSSQETINHIFCTGEFARQVWGFFEVPIGGFGAAFMIRHKVINWWLKSGRTSYIRFLFRILPALICWNLWKTRNKFVFEGRVATVTQVCGRIVNELHESFGAQFRRLVYLGRGLLSWMR